MLDPRERDLLLEALRPPDGYELCRAIGTTFSLDLLALLTAPLAFTLFDWEDEHGKPDPLALLESIRRYADRLTIFCQAGRIAIPREHKLLYSYLESSVIEVTPQHSHGVFHPKVWVLRYIPVEDKTQPVQYRLLVLSRNLTFDQSWDTILVLDGWLTDRKSAYAVNHPLGDFIAALPDLAVRPVSPTVTDTIDQMQDEIRRVQFEDPPGMTIERFWPLGLPKKRRRWPFEGRIDRLLVLSPFITPSCLSQLTEHGRNHVLISRLDSLSELTASELSGFDKVFALSPEAAAEPADIEDDVVNQDIPLSGLHAKLYVADAGYDARIWTGSANATGAAFNSNVEFLIELSGKKSQIGINQLLKSSGDKNQVGFGDLLATFTPGDQPVEVDPVHHKLEKHLNEIAQSLQQTRPFVQVEPADSSDTYHLAIKCEQPDSTVHENVKITCWPITLDETIHALSASLQTTTIAELASCSFEAISSFIAFQITVSMDDQSENMRFVLNLPLEGAPEGRQERLLQHLLKNQHQFLRFLMLLLADDKVDTATLAEALPDGSVQIGVAGNDFNHIPLFEALVRALDQNPCKLDQVAQVVNDLKQTPEGQSILPDDFDSIWQPIWTARQRLES